MHFLDKYKKLPVAAKASIWFVICSILQKGIAFISTPIFTRLMSTEQYGQVTIYNSWLEIIVIFGTLNLFYGVYNNALTKYPEEKEVATSSMQGLCTAITLLLLVIYLCTKKIINKLTGLSSTLFFLMIVETLFTPAYRFWYAKLRFQYKYRPLIVISLLISIFTAVGGVIAVSFSTEKGIAKIVSGVVVQLFIAIPIYFSIFRNGKKFYDKKYWSYALRFNLPLIPHYLSSTILNQSDRVMINSMCGTSQAGIYGLAYTIGMLSLIVEQAIMNTFTPYSYQKLKVEEYDSIKKYSSFFVIGIGIISVLFVAFAPEIVWILGGDRYIEGMWIIAPISASIFFRFICSLYSLIEFYYEENYFIMIASSMCAVINIIANYVGINKFGYLAPGYTTLGCFVLYALAHYIFSTKVLKKHTRKKSLFDNKIILFSSILVILGAMFTMILFNLKYIRYGILGVALLLVIFYRKKIFEIIYGIRDKSK